MDLKMPDVSNEVWPAEQRLAAPVDIDTSSNQDSPQEIQERKELAAELEAMLDAAGEAEAAEIEACNQSFDVEMDMDIDEIEETDPEGNPQEQEKYERPQPEPNLTQVSPSTAPPLLSTGPLMSDPVPRYPYYNRSIRVPISPVQKIIAQQFLGKSRAHLKETSAGRNSRLSDEEKETTNLKIRTGNARNIPEPAAMVLAQSSTECQQNQPRMSGTNQMIPSPADDPGMHLNELWRALDRPSTVDERRTYYGNSRRRQRQQERGRKL